MLSARRQSAFQSSTLASSTVLTTMNELAALIAWLESQAQKMSPLRRLPGFGAVGFGLPRGVG